MKSFPKFNPSQPLVYPKATPTLGALGGLDGIRAKKQKSCTPHFDTKQYFQGLDGLATLGVQELQKENLDFSSPDHSLDSILTPAFGSFIKAEYEERIAVAQYDGAQDEYEARHIAYKDGLKTVLKVLEEDGIHCQFQTIVKAQEWLSNHNVFKPTRNKS